MDELLQHEPAVRLGFFFGVFAAMALWERLATRRAPGAGGLAPHYGRYCGAAHRAEAMVEASPLPLVLVEADGSVIRLAKLHPDYDPHNRVAAMAYLQARHAAGEIVTGLLYLDPEAQDLHDSLGTTKAPLNAMNEDVLCPGAKALDAVNDSYR